MVGNGDEWVADWADLASNCTDWMTSAGIPGERLQLLWEVGWRQQQLASGRVVSRRQLGRRLVRRSRRGGCQLRSVELRQLHRVPLCPLSRPWALALWSVDPWPSSVGRA